MANAVVTGAIIPLISPSQPVALSEQQKSISTEERIATLQQKVITLQEANTKMSDLLVRHAPALMDSICRKLILEIHNHPKLEAQMKHGLSAQDTVQIEEAFAEIEAQSTLELVKEQEHEFVIVCPKTDYLEELLSDIQEIMSIVREKNAEQAQMQFNAFLTELRPHLLDEERASRVRRLLSRGCTVTWEGAKVLYNKARTLSNIVNTASTLTPAVMIVMNILAKRYLL